MIYRSNFWTGKLYKIAGPETWNVWEVLSDIAFDFVCAIDDEDALIYASCKLLLRFFHVFFFFNSSVIVLKSQTQTAHSQTNMVRSKDHNLYIEYITL